MREMISRVNDRVDRADPDDLGSRLSDPLPVNLTGHHRLYILRAKKHIGFVSTVCVSANPKYVTLSSIKGHTMPIHLASS